MTLEAWVTRPHSASWRTVADQGAARRLAYGLYASTRHQPARARRHHRRAEPTRAAPRRCPSTPGPTWPRPTTARRCACTSTGPGRRRRASPGRCATRPAPCGSAATHLGRVLRRPIDEVRVYNRALTAAEIQTDMNRGRPRSPTRSRRPRRAASRRPAASARSRWAGRRPPTTSASPATTCTARPRPASRRRRRTGSRSRRGTTYTDTGLAAGTYHYRVTAEDAAGNVGPASNEASRRR